MDHRARHRLGALDGGDVTSRVRSSFSWSYDSLTKPPARLFRLLGIHSGPDISTAGLASLAGCPWPAARTLVAELTCANLISERLHGRYALHDLLRAYAIELTRAHDEEEGRRAASARLLGDYADTAYVAVRLVKPRGDACRGPGLAATRMGRRQNPVCYE